MIKKASVMTSIMMLSACSITQVIEPAEIVKGSELCIIENTDVREGFLKEYQSVLSSKSISHRLVSENSVPDSCEWTSTYVARWTWDLALYMSYAEIKVFYKGNLDGEAKYDSTKGGANMSKFIDAEPKIRELVNQLMQIKLASLFVQKFG
ncbi:MULTISPECIES: Sbal_3080 family lipoprotein [unclassified Marinobacter]|uniref:Sbal_3080 family lipoprotein n=1 Tax=unclassified Marinobacter TaxID=83889 RepID=UPI00200D6AC2|nr:MULTISPECIES: Sbal_3080 family lipoprotein [unclassified Marinobacter]UQG55095.1 Sbal_3080 family lipoprotein [Marinobacter sp. M4C]UQG63896.1 Sbal_3080 family lipoprotein [Marinobacter sp. M2C]UQG68180.1 Sbal_3080 family lipoprotein [Marinobacter sp. M1C]